MSNIQDPKTLIQSNASLDLTPTQKWLESLSYTAALNLLSEETEDLFNSLNNLKNDSDFAKDPSNLHKIYTELDTIYNTYEYGIENNPNVTQAQKDAVNNNPDGEYFSWMFNSLFDPASHETLTQALNSHDFNAVQRILKNLPTDTNKKLLDAWVWNTQKVQGDLANYVSQDPDYKPVALPKDLAATLSGQLGEITSLLQDILNNPSHINDDAQKLLDDLTAFINTFLGAMKGTTLTAAQKNTLQAYAEPFLMDIAGSFGHTLNKTILDAVNDKSTSELESILTDLTSNTDSNKFLSGMIKDGQTAAQKIGGQAQVTMLASEQDDNWVDKIGYTGTALVLYDELKSLSNTLKTLKDHPDYFQNNNYAYPQELYNQLQLLKKTIAEIKSSNLTDEQKKSLTDTLEPFADDIFALSDGTTTIDQALQNNDPATVQKIINANSASFGKMFSEAQTAFSSIKSLVTSLQPPETKLPKEQTEQIIGQLLLLKTLLKDVAGDPSFFNNGDPSQNYFIQGLINFYQSLSTTYNQIKNDPNISDNQKALFALVLAPLYQELSAIGDPKTGTTLAQALQDKDPKEIQTILYQLYQNDYHYNGQIANIDIDAIIGELRQYEGS